MNKLNQNNSIQSDNSIPQKDIPVISELFTKLSDHEKLLLLEILENGTITSKDVAIYEMTLEKLKKEVIAKFYPYIREGSQIVYFVPSKNQYKARIPNALRKEGTPIPQCTVTELQMWNNLHKYLYGDIENSTL